MATMNPQAARPAFARRSRTNADEEPPRRTHAAIVALFSCVVVSLAATIAVIATTSPA
jgi:hypothetical protein